MDAEVLGVVAIGGASAAVCGESGGNAAAPLSKASASGGASDAIGVVGTVFGGSCRGVIGRPLSFGVTGRR
jgi:hypothetical protein